MTPEATKLLQDILNASNKILSRTDGKTVEQYEADEDLCLVIERLFTIAGEAAARLYRDYPEVASQLSEVRGVISFRNFLIHVYDTVDNRKVWDIVQTELPKLQQQVTELLSE